MDIPNRPHHTSDTAVALSIIVVTWNGWPLLEAMLRSLRTFGEARPDIELLVVDNGSTDETAERLARDFPAARYLPQSTNLGFARANNVGFDAARGALVMLLNNDTTVEPGAIEALLDAAAAHEDFDIFVPEMRIMRAPTLVDNRGIYLDRAAHFRQLDSGAVALPQRQRCEVFGASGGACLMRRSVVERVGLFDESLESYLEDADFAARARVAGFRALFVPDSIILHAGSATGERIASHKYFLIQRNMWTLRRRWFGFSPARSSTWLGVGYEFLHALKAVRAGRTGIWLRAKRAGRGSGMRAANRAALRAWVGIKARPLDTPAPRGVDGVGARP